MDCKKSRKLMSDRLDSRLPENESSRFDLHNDTCRQCKESYEEVAYIGTLLKVSYPAAAAPAGFSARVMNRIETEEIRKEFVFPTWFKISLGPVAAMTLSAALLYGIFFAPRALAPVNVPDEQARVIEEVELPFVQENGLEEIVPSLEDSLTVVLPVEEPDVVIAHVEATQEEVEVEPVYLEPVVLTPPTQEREPDGVVNGDKPAALPVNGAAIKVPSVAIPINDGVVYLEEENVFQYAGIPDSSVFKSRKRVIDAAAVSVAVRRIDSSLPELERLAQNNGLTPDMTINSIRDDGTIVVMRSFVVPVRLANTFINSVRSIGDASSVKRSSLDITGEYSDMLATHRQLIGERILDSKDVSQINTLISELVMLDNRSKPGFLNVVVWLEDGVDF